MDTDLDNISDDILSLTATVKSIDPAAFMDQAGSDYVLAVRVLHAGSIIMTHAVAA
jgi:hypothetical protein